MSDEERQRTRLVHRDLVERLVNAEWTQQNALTLTRDEVSVIVQRLAVHLMDDTDDEPGDEGLRQLLADVHRIAEGMDGIHALVVQGAPAATAPRASRLSDAEVLAFTRVNGECRAARKLHALNASVPVQHLETLLGALARVGE